MKIPKQYKWKIIVILSLSVMIVAGLIYLTVLRMQKGLMGKPIASSEPTAEVVTPEPTEVATVEPTQEPIIEEEPEASAEPIVSDADTTSNDSYTKLVNKTHPIDESYVPADLVNVDVRSDVPQTLRAEAAEQLTRLFNDAIEQQIYFKLISGYRSYAEQAEWEEYYIELYGAEAVEGMDCHPGTSEHQLGLAVDLGNWNSECDMDVCFSWYPTYTFLVEHGHEYGFVERYPTGTSDITGYDEAVWHWRYVGVEEAAKLHDSGLTMEQYYGN